nr:hypothetical protein [Tanacetum cinerariifolium]
MTSYGLLHQYDHHPFGKKRQQAQYQVERTQIVDGQLEHIPHEALRMMDSTHCGSQMIENHSKDRLVKEVLMMVLVMHTKEDDMVLHIEKTGMLMLVVEIDIGGMTADFVDKLTCSSDDVQPKQVDLSSTHALTELNWHDTHVDPDRHEVDQRYLCADLHLEEIHVNWAQLEKKRTRLQLYIEELCTVPGDGVAIPSDAVISYKLWCQDFQDGIRTVGLLRLCHIYKTVHVAAFDSFKKYGYVMLLGLIVLGIMKNHQGGLQVRLLILLLAAKGLLLDVYGGRMVERDNFSPQQPPHTHRQERLMNKEMMSLLVGRNRGKAVCILAWQLTKVTAMAYVYCFSDGLPF